MKFNRATQERPAVSNQPEAVKNTGKFYNLKTKSALIWFTMLTSIGIDVSMAEEKKTNKKLVINIKKSGKSKDFFLKAEPKLCTL